MTSAEPSPRARFWRRVFAFFIDGCAVVAIIAAIGISLFSATDGRIRVANTLVNRSTCSQGSAVPAGLNLPANFNVTHVVRCTRYFFGVVHDRTLTVREVTRSGSLTHTRSITFPVDADGRPMRAFYLDHFGIFLLPAISCCRNGALARQWEKAWSACAYGHWTAGCLPFLKPPNAYLYG
jgi:hypothetical protein